jgi:uncharacterized protein YndB with AHSA1/START domain
MNLPHSLNRTIVIEAPRDTVFRYFTDSDRWAKWWGAGSTIDPHPGGAMFIRYPNAVEVRGEVVEVFPPARIVFTYGYVSGQPIGVGESRVTIHLDEVAGGTRLRLQQDFAAEPVRDQHVQGWRYQLAVFSNTVADDVQSAAADRIDSWYKAWRTADGAERAALLQSACAPDVAFRDRWANVETLAELGAHLDALQRMMPGIALEGRGSLRHCQGTALSDWAAISADGSTVLSGTNVFRFNSAGRIQFVTGFPSQK